MKNKNYKVVLFVGITFFIYLVISIISSVGGFHWEPFDKINLISGIYNKNEDFALKGSKNADTLKALAVENRQDINLYKKGGIITNFYPNDTLIVLPQFVEKLKQLKATGKGKIRIAFFGDSMIEGDLITQTFRELLQKEFGGERVGYLPLNSNVAKFRQSATIKANGWQIEHFKNKGAKDLYISGYSFKGSGSGFYKDNTIKNKDVRIQKSILFGKTDKTDILANETSYSLRGNNAFNRQVVRWDLADEISISTASSGAVFFGVSFESENGIFVDNFSFRGITGVELNKIDEEFFANIQKENPYDLVVFQYGVNLLFRPKDTDYSYYYEMMKPVFSKIKRGFSSAEFLLISTADRAFRYDGEYKTAIGISNLIEIQARLALEHQFAFYNQFATMGGENSIVKWANSTPALANKDYTHPNHKGAEQLAEYLYTALINDYKKKNK